MVWRSGEAREGYGGLSGLRRKRAEGGWAVVLLPPPLPPAAAAVVEGRCCFLVGWKG